MTWIAQEAQDGERGSGEIGEPLGHAGPARPMPVFIPPAVFHKEEAVLDLPMAAHMLEKLRGGSVLRIEAGNEVASFGQTHGAVVGDDVTVDAHSDLTTWKVERLANVRLVV